MAIAGNFKNAIANISDVDGFVAVYTAPVDKTSYIIECDVACTSNSGVQVSVRLQKADTSTAHIVKDAPVPVGSAIQVIDGQKVVLEAGDSLEVKCETASSTVDVVVSLVEDVNI